MFFFFFFGGNLEEASIGWVSHNHRPSTQWIIIYRLVVFLTPPFITSFWASSIILDFRLWMIILIALASGEIGDLTIFGLRWSIWKPCCCAKLFLTLSRTKVVWNKRLTVHLAEIWVPSAEGKGKKKQFPHYGWTLSRKYYNHVIYKETCTDPSVCSQWLKVALFSYFIASNVPPL